MYLKIKALCSVLVVLGTTLTLVMGSTSCKTKKDTTTKADTVLTYSMGACMGKCPQFTLVLFSNGKAHYLPKKHTPITEATAFTFNVQDLAEIARIRTENNLDALGDLGIAPDFPVTSVTFYGKNKKLIESTANRPQGLAELHTHLNVMLKEMLESGKGSPIK